MLRIVLTTLVMMLISGCARTIQEYPYNTAPDSDGRLGYTAQVSGKLKRLDSVTNLTAPIMAVATDLTHYGDALAAGWQDWSWDTTDNFNNASPIQSGTKSISVQYTAAWASLYLHTDSALDLSGYDSLRFWIYGTSSGQQLRDVANGADPGYTLTATANQWAQINVPLISLGSPATLNDLYWQDTTGGAQAVFYLDAITLVASTGTPTPIPTPGSGPALNVNVALDRKSISPYIYGMNFADETLANELALPVRRWGGNSTSRYNWQNDFSNTGSDWYFENIPQDYPLPSGLPNGSASDQFVDQDRRTNTRTLLTVPLIGWVAKNSSANHPYACGFKVGKYGAQDSVDSWDTDCGNGVHNGTNLTGNNPTDTSIAVDHTFVQGWINHLTSRYGTAANGGVLLYDLDNEPMLWNSTHRDVHPQPTTYDEMLTRTVEIAPAIKAADPTARTLGPVLWGWCAYFFSALDNCSSSGTDYTSHGNIAFVPWYLQQMQAYDQAHSQRILDYLDLHYYPQANGVSLSPAGNATTQALRLRSTRSLWDPTYVDESWIGGAGWEGGIVRLIPRMKDWVSANYPGTKTAITEYNWGGLESINGALAQADVLGIFGREGLDLATIWGPPTSAQPGAYAFRMYRNYDGAGSQFGDTSVRATSADQGTLAIYAAQRSTDQALTLIIINKTGTAQTSTLSLSGFTPATSAQIFRYSAANLNAIIAQPAQSIASNGFTATFPANSISLVVIATGAPLNNHVWLPLVCR